jgi:hypothetical protein
MLRIDKVPVSILQPELFAVFVLLFSSGKGKRREQAYYSANYDFFL